MLESSWMVKFSILLTMYKNALCQEAVNNAEMDTTKNACRKYHLCFHVTIVIIINIDVGMEKFNVDVDIKNITLCHMKPQES